MIFNNSDVVWEDQNMHEIILKMLIIHFLKLIYKNKWSLDYIFGSKFNYLKTMIII